MAAGLDVQIHAEDRIVEMLRERYIDLSDDHWWKDYTYQKTYSLDGTTGQVTVDVSSDIRKFSDIRTIFYNQDDRPLPQLSIATNPTKVKRRCIDPVADVTKVFRVLPIDSDGPIHLWHRLTLTEQWWDDKTYDEDIPMDATLLVLGVAADFLVDDGDNDLAAKNLMLTYDTRLEQFRNLQFNLPLFKTDQSQDTTDDWWSH